MSGQQFERESRRARKRRRKERDRQLQASGAKSGGSQLGIREVFSPPEASEVEEAPADDLPELASDDASPTFVEPTACELEAEDGNTSTPPESASEQVAALQHELQEKDELLDILTAQLEEAANRLDRLHRAGADRAPRVPMSGGDGLSAGSDIGEQLARLCSEWDEVQLAEQFEIIRGRLDDIFDAVSLEKLTEQSRALERRPVANIDDVEPAPAPTSRATDSASSLPGWEAMKAQLLREGAEQGRSHNNLDEAASSVSDSAAEVLNDLPLEPPASVHLETADRDTLVTAVEERDVFISHLIRRLRSGTSGRYEPINWAEVSGAPEELRERLEEHEARLQELLRMEECDLSLERARLARERARLEQLRRDVERDSRGGEEPGEDADRNERRWLRVFGFGRKPDGDSHDE